MFTQQRLGILLVSLSIGVLSCRSRDNETQRRLPTPSRVKSDEATLKLYAESNGEGFRLAGKEQHLEVNLAVERVLDRQGNDKAPLFQCATPFPPATQLGEVRCKTNGQISKPLLAKHCLQVCSGGHDPFADIAPSAMFPKLTDCADVEINIYEFKPSVRVRMVER